MKDLIGSVLIIAGLFGTGGWAAREIHDSVRKAALEKVNQGMPSLTGLTRALRTQR